MPLRKHNVFLLVFLILFWLYSTITHYPKDNELSRFGLTWSIVEKGDFDIDPFAEFTIDKSFKDGHFYSDKAPGLSFIGVPAYALYRRSLEPKVLSFIMRRLAPDADPSGNAVRGIVFATKMWAARVFTVSLLSALFGTFFIFYLMKTAADPSIGVICGAGYALGSMAYAYSTLFYAHQLVAALLFMAFYIISELGSEKGASPWQRTLRAAFAGILLGVAFVCEFPSAIIGIVLACFMLFRLLELSGWNWRSRAAADFAVFMLAGLLALIPLLSYNHICFGSPFSLGYSNLATEKYRVEMEHGFFGICLPSLSAAWGITFGSSRGIFLLSPFLLLIFPAAYRKLKESLKALKADPSYLAALLAVAGYFLFNASYRVWDGGCAIGPRHFIPALPFAVYLMMPLAGKAWRITSSVLVSVSILFMLVATATDPQVVGTFFPLWTESWPMFVKAKISLTPFHFLGFAGAVPLCLYVLPPLLISMLLAYFRFLRPPLRQTQ